MQIKKEEVMLAILREAEKEFLEKGFVDASIRKIVKAAGTTIGNFYNYFENKEALFEALVKDEYGSFTEFIKNHNKLEPADFLPEKPDASQLREALTMLMPRLLPSFSDRFILLIECSKGTKFEDSRQELLNIFKEHFLEHIREFGAGKVNIAMAEIISQQVLLGLALILKQHKDEKQRRELLTEHLLYHLLGTMGLLGGVQ